MTGSERSPGPARRLAEWFRGEARDLPWRGSPRDPYRVLVSELMLQQTQVLRVVPRFLAFVERFPTLADLAAAPEEEVLAAWSGLGYYSRARNLHRAARALAEGGGALPREAGALQRLPGLGPYTAAAVASLAFGEAEPVLDGNVRRVAARALALAADPRTAAGARRAATWVRELMAEDAGDGTIDPGVVNEALMELGATVCRPRRPRCEACPLEPDCHARAQGQPEVFPRPRAGSVRAAEEHRWIAACCVDPEGRWLLRRVDSGPVLRRLWLPPFDPAAAGGDPADLARALVSGLGRNAVGKTFEPVRHSITFRRIAVAPVRFLVSHLRSPGEGWAWAAPDAPGLPTSTLLAKLAARLGADDAGGRP